MVKICIYSNGHIITSIIQPLPSHPCLLLTVELQTKAAGIRVLYLYCENYKKKQLLCIQGMEGVTGRGEMSEQMLLSRAGSSHVYLVGRVRLFRRPPRRCSRVGLNRPGQKGK